MPPILFLDHAEFTSILRQIYSPLWSMTIPAKRPYILSCLASYLSIFNMARIPEMAYILNDPDSFPTPGATLFMMMPILKENWTTFALTRDHLLECLTNIYTELQERSTPDQYQELSYYTILFMSALNLNGLDEHRSVFGVANVQIPDLLQPRSPWDTQPESPQCPWDTPG
jgi:hypothetical protein